MKKNIPTFHSRGTIEVASGFVNSKCRPTSPQKSFLITLDMFTTALRLLAVMNRAMLSMAFCFIRREKSVII